MYAATGGTGTSSAGATVQGARAGTEAAEYVKKAGKILLSNTDITEATDRVFLPRIREKGYSPAWVTQVLQHNMGPYYVLYLKREDRLNAALTNIEFLRDHFAPNLMAKDTHDLRLAHETENMLLNAEMMLRASLFRTESRGSHRREDFPNQDDKNWLAWVIVSRDGDNMKLTKRPIPEEWKPGAQR
jgi:succinate dehydrogenase/fumarate reductase flavoprotein subunit